MTDPTKPNPSKTIARFGVKLLNALLYEQEPVPADKRKEDPRNPVAGEVVVVKLVDGKPDAEKHRMFIRDLSTGGCGLWSRTRIEPGTSVLVHFQGPDNENVERMATIRHCRGQEGSGFAIGVQFSVEAKSKNKKKAA